MAKPEWGNRYVCFSCGCKYYDLNRPEPLCPRCEADPREAVLAARTPSRQTREASSPEEEGEDLDSFDEVLDVRYEASDILDDDVSEDDEEEEGEEEDY